MWPLFVHRLKKETHSILGFNLRSSRLYLDRFNLTSFLSDPVEIQAVSSFQYFDTISVKIVWRGNAQRVHYFGTGLSVCLLIQERDLMCKLVSSSH